jgi:hypothetical protein
MNIGPSLVHIRDHIITSLPNYFSKNNCIVTATFLPLSQLYRHQLQIFYAGTTDLIGQMGSNLDRVYSIGIGISTNLNTDVVGATEDQSLELINLMKSVITYVL